MPTTQFSSIALNPAHVEARRKENFDRRIAVLSEICSLAKDFKVPAIDHEQVPEIIKELKNAESSVRALRVSIEKHYANAVNDDDVPKEAA